MTDANEQMFPNTAFGTEADANNKTTFPSADDAQAEPGNNGTDNRTAGADDTLDQTGVDAAGDGQVPVYAEFDIPDGITVDQGDMNAYRDLSGQMGLSQDQAQKLLSFEADRLRQMDDRLTDQRMEQARNWAEAAQSDAEYGGDAFNRNVALARHAVDTFASPEVRDMLEATGLGSHPEFIRMFWKMGRSVASDGALTGGQGGGSTRLDNRSLFPNSNHN